MEIHSPFTGLTYKSCFITGAPSRDAAIDFAMAHFGETRGRLFDLRATSHDGITWAVTLYTD